MVSAVSSFAPLSGAAPFLRTYRLGRGTVCLVSAVSRGRSSGNCFPQLGPQISVITGEAVTSRFRSSPILMEWWSAQCNDYTKLLIAAEGTRQHSTKRGAIVQARAASPSVWEALARSKQKHLLRCQVEDSGVKLKHLVRLL